MARVSNRHQTIPHYKVANESDVEDLLQDILIKTYKNLPRVKDQSSIKSWLFQIANNTIIDFYRKKGREQTLTAEELELMDDGSEGNTAKDALVDCVVPFIEALPKDQAELLRAIDIDGQSQKEYAEKLGVSYSTLKSRVQKSRSELKAVFDHCCDFQIDRFGSIYDYNRKNDGCGNC